VAELARAKVVGLARGKVEELAREEKSLDGVVRLWTDAHE
jgi:hypothetical protein